MTTSAKSATKPAAKAAPKTAAKPALKARRTAAPAPAEPFLRFYLAHDLYARTQAVLDALESAAEQTDHADSLADLVAELTAAGMNYYYLRALQAAQIGFVGEQSARLALSGAVRLISAVSRKFIVRMDNAQLLRVAQHIRDLAR
jgi:hypothetical protein